MGNCIHIRTEDTVKPVCNDETIQKDALVPKKRGVEGLRAAGFEYRRVCCPLHNNPDEEDDPSLPQDADRIDPIPFCADCATSLFHIESGTRITAENRKQYIRDGAHFDVVAGHCQEVVQDRIQKEYGFQFITICNHYKRAPLQALVSQEFGEDTPQSATPPTLVIIAGKGKSRAGVLSVMHLLVSGIEQGSAIFYICQAQKRGWRVCLLDPNAWEAANGREVIDKSLTFMMENFYPTNDNDDPAVVGSPLYIFAHSAAGGFLSRYLFDGSARKVLLDNIRSLVFTDSTHNIQWVQEDPKLYRFLQSKKCLYIRNTSESPKDTFASHKDKKPGEVCEGNIWWKRRFGNLRTVWAGTTDHSLMCWVAREVAWEFFDAS